MVFPSLQQAREIAKEGVYGAIPVSCEIYSDSRTPIEALRILKQCSGHCYMLESIEDTQRWGRYTFLGFEPTLELACKDGTLTVKHAGEAHRVRASHPGEAIRAVLQAYRSPRLAGLPPFTGGLVGYFSYDYIQYSEPELVLDAQDTEAFNDVDLMLFDKVVAFDNFRQKIILIVNARTKELEAEYARACKELARLAELLRTGQPAVLPKPVLKTPFCPLFSKERYCEMVEQGKRYIREGDIFQVVLSNRMEAGLEGSLFDAYRVLRTTNPSPYMFYFSSGELEVAGASPETLVKLQDGALYTFPLAGTRPRGTTPSADEALERELLADEKELAEHNMLVDLGRNDIGRISEIGSVQVEQYLTVQKYSHVMHIGSTVSGKLREGCDAVDALDAILPAGTLSGAPKIRACEIINALEDNKRGIYGGAIGYLDFTGNLDTCIAIRIAYAKNGKVFVRSGAGIVADSVPQTEYQECINKAQAVVSAIMAAQEGIDV